jgi:hypothetical protein
MTQLSPEEIDALERQVREATRQVPPPLWQPVLVVACLLGGSISLIWGNAVFGGVLIVCGSFLKWFFRKFD